jgi:hypothetical protein
MSRGCATAASGRPSWRTSAAAKRTGMARPPWAERRDDRALRLGTIHPLLVTQNGTDCRFASGNQPGRLHAADPTIGLHERASADADTTQAIYLILTTYRDKCALYRSLYYAYFLSRQADGCGAWFLGPKALPAALLRRTRTATKRAGMARPPGRRGGEPTCPLVSNSLLRHWLRRRHASDTPPRLKRSTPEGRSEGHAVGDIRHESAH